MVWSELGVRDAKNDLQAVQVRTSQLTAEKARYAEVPRVLAQVEAAEDIRAKAMATDVLWYRYLNDVALAVPSPVWLTQLSMAVPATGITGTGIAVAPPAAPGTGPSLTPDGIGTLTFTAKGSKFPDAAAWMDSLEGGTGFDGVTLSNATADDDTAEDEPTIVEFSGDVVITEDALSHSPRYNRRAS